MTDHHDQEHDMTDQHDPEPYIVSAEHLAAQHDADELELPPSAELLYTTPAAASDAAELDRLRRLPGEMTLKSFTAYEYNEAVQALLYPGSDPITGGTRELLVPTVQRVAAARGLDLEELWPTRAPTPFLTPTELTELRAHTDEHADDRCKRCGDPYANDLTGLCMDCELA